MRLLGHFQELARIFELRLNSVEFLLHRAVKHVSDALESRLLVILVVHPGGGYICNSVSSACYLVDDVLTMEILRRPRSGYKQGSVDCIARGFTGTTIKMGADCSSCENGGKLLEENNL